jgi:Ni,Fe-hydrogenase III large subunit/Ni,Fe-hydrogenase III component G
MGAENERYITVGEEGFRSRAAALARDGNPLRTMFAADEREPGGTLTIYAAFSLKGEDVFEILRFPVEEKNGTFSYRSITPTVPAAHWYEREIRDMFGIAPEGHPDPRPLVLHGLYQGGLFPLRRDRTAEEIRKAVNLDNEDNYRFMEVKGEGVYEIPVGPVHAGIIEPGHFRFSAVGESVFFLDARLFYTHKGIEKHFETVGFEKGVALSERVSGFSSFAHSAAYCQAVERMAGVEIPLKAKVIRTLLLELERLYNHVGDIGNLCAGTALAVGYASGALIKEKLMRLGERLTGSRFLRGVNALGGVQKDVLVQADDMLFTLDEVKGDYKGLMELLLGAVSHVERLENTGRLSRDIALGLGATGIAARASGINDDMRTIHKHLYYDSVVFEPHTRQKGDVMARMMVRADEVECSLSIVESLLKGPYGGDLKAETVKIQPRGQALGYVEGPRGSVFYFVKSDDRGSPLRVKPRSASFCNWPVVPYAVRGNIVPDFPLINKSFNLSYSGCDM